MLNVTKTTRSGTTHQPEGKRIDPASVSAYGTWCWSKGSPFQGKDGGAAGRKNPFTQPSGKEKPPSVPLGGKTISHGNQRGTHSVTKDGNRARSGETSFQSPLSRIGLGHYRLEGRDRGKRRPSGSWPFLHRKRETRPASSPA